MLPAQDATPAVIPLPLATVLYPARHPLAGETGVVNVFAIRHPRGLVLVDTGVGEGNAWIDEHYRPERRSLAAALQAHALSAEGVTAVINTHLHFDHCGENHRFAGIPLYVQATEYEAAHQPSFTVEEWVDVPGALYRQLDGEAEIMPGIRLIPTPGHTPGHQSVLVQTADGLVLLAGQAVQDLAAYHHLHRTGELPAGSAAPDEQSHRTSARRLLTYHPQSVYFSHDRAIRHADGEES